MNSIFDKLTLYRINSLTRKLFISYIFLLAFFLIFSMVLVVYILKHETKIFIKYATNDIYRIIKDDVELYLISNSDLYLNNLKNVINSYPYTLGIVIYDDHFSPILVFKKKKYKDPQEKKVVDKIFLFKDKSVGKVYSEIKEIKIKLFPRLSKEKLIGYVRLDISYDYFNKPQRHIILVQAVAYFLFALIAAIVAIYLSSNLHKPFQDLTKFAKELEKGNFDVNIKEKTGLIELDKLIETFNAMARELKRSHIELMKSNEKLRIIAEFTADWEYWQAPDGTFIYVSPSCKSITGYEAEEFKQNPHLYEEIIVPEDRPAWQQHHEEAHVQLKPENEIEFRIVAADGTKKWISHLCSPVYSNSGKYLGIRGSNRDITYRKKLEDQILQTQKLESVTRLAGGVAHDLNNLMAAIIGHIELICFKAKDDPKIAEHANKIMNIAQKASALAEQLLNYARGGPFKPEVVDLNQIIRETVEFQEISLPPYVNFVFSLDPNLEKIYGDKSQLSQVIMNLVMNAAEAIKEKGTIWIETYNVKILEEIDNIPPGDYVLLRVKDNGEGMDSETLNKIFEPFFSTKDFGRGLGLAAVFGIIKNHRGQIKVYSEKGKGTTFEIFIPVYRPHNGDSA